MCPNDNNLIEIHRSSFRNREQILESSVCGCFCCLETFMPIEIEEWVDKGQTAVCPFCMIDSVIASDIEDVLKEMQKEWFSES